jgi:RimJ/RimL family protein N-acetyltransferase
VLPEPPADLHPKARSVVDLYESMRQENRRFGPGRSLIRPRSCYRNLPDSVRLRYELLDWSNFRTLLDLFQHDPSPFVMPSLKIPERVDLYAAYQLSTGRYSGKHGGADWFLHLPDGTPVGVLHLYDLSFEWWEGKRFPCMCGYAIGERFRRQGYAEEALRHLLSVLPTQFLIYEVQAEPLRANEPSQALLRKTGFTFQRNIKNEHGPSALWYQQVVSPMPYTPWEAVEALSDFGND